MNKQQRREFFERLCAMRDAYAARGPEDAASVITIDAIVARASRKLDRPRATVAVVNDEAKPA